VSTGILSLPYTYHKYIKDMWAILKISGFPLERKEFQKNQFILSELVKSKRGQVF